MSISDKTDLTEIAFIFTPKNFPFFVKIKTPCAIVKSPFTRMFHVKHSKIDKCRMLPLNTRRQTP